MSLLSAATTPLATQALLFVAIWQAQLAPSRIVEPLRGVSALSTESTPRHRLRDRRQITGAAMVAALFVVGWQLAAVIAVVGLVQPIHERRQLARQLDIDVGRELPQIVDLFVVALQAGNNVTTSTRRVAELCDGPIASALHARLAIVDSSGIPLADALDTVPEDVGPSVRPLIGALVAAERWGVSIVDSLALIATEVRVQRRRQAETAARRLPVQMLFPLVTCVLPAFGLLTVVPVLVDSLRTLSW